MLFRKRIGFQIAGITKMSFALPYRNGMIWCEHLDSLGDHTDVTLEKLAGDMTVFIRPSVTSQLVVVLNETLVNHALCTRMAEVFAAPNSHVRRLAFVGLDWVERRRLEREMQNRNMPFAMRYFADLEMAKEWLIPA